MNKTDLIFKALGLVEMIGELKEVIKNLCQFTQHQGACKFSKDSDPCTCGLDELKESNGTPEFQIFQFIQSLEGRRYIGKKTFETIIEAYKEFTKE